MSDRNDINFNKASDTLSTEIKWHMNLMLIRIYRIKEVSNTGTNIYTKLIFFSIYTPNNQKKEENISVSKYYNIYYKMKCEKVF